MRISCLWKNGTVTEENLARGQTSGELKKKLGRKYFDNDGALLVLKVENNELPDSADLAGWIGTTERHEVFVDTEYPHLENNRDIETPRAEPIVAENAQQRTRTPTPTPTVQPTPTPTVQQRRASIRIKLGDGASLMVEKDCIVTRNTLYLKNSVISDIKNAGNLKRVAKSPVDLLVEAGALVITRCKDWKPEIDFLVSSVIIYTIWWLNRLTLISLFQWPTLVILGPAFLVLVNLSLDVFAGIRLDLTKRYVDLPELYRDASAEEIAKEVPESALAYITDTERVVKEMRQNATKRQAVLLFFVSAVYPIQSRWEREMKRRKGIYESAVNIARRQHEARQEAAQINTPDQPAPEN